MKAKITVLMLCLLMLFLGACARNADGSFARLTTPAPMDVDDPLQGGVPPTLPGGQDPQGTLPLSHDVATGDALPAGVCYVKGSGVRMRAEPSVKARIVMILEHGEKMEKFETQEGWTRVRTGSLGGYVRNDLLSDTPPTVPPAATKHAAQAPGADRETILAAKKPSIIIQKAARTLQLWDGDTLLASYPIGLGWAPEGHKYAEGDGKTPEGGYYVCTRNSKSSYYLSLGVSYPNQADAKAALERGDITQETHDNIADAISKGGQPPWNTILGGAIMIHGMGAERDWTAGCIAVDNDVMDILWETCTLGTRIQINP